MAASGPASSVPPRVLLVLPDQWPRALLRAALREVGYDALGAPGLAGAARYRVQAPGRGPVRLVLVDQSALDDASATLLPALLQRHANPASILVTRATASPPVPSAAAHVPWNRSVRRPVSIAELVALVQQLLPLPPDSARPID
jgi:hypothetical protein